MVMVFLCFGTLLHHQALKSALVCSKWLTVSDIELCNMPSQITRRHVRLDVRMKRNEGRCQAIVAARVTPADA